MASVTLDHITHEYHDDGNETLVAVDDAQLDIEDGEFVVLVGPSGCGKTTTLEIVAGLLQPSHGGVTFGGENVTGIPARKRDIAMVFQSYALYPHMTVRENMAFPLKQRADLSGEDADERVRRAAKTMGIANLLDRRPSDLSGGQKQRVALGRAIVREPAVFLMDEPLSNLDAKLRREMRVELQELHDQLGTTTVYVTHNQEEAMTMSDRIVVMNRGEIQQIGPPQEVYEQPVNRFVAEFIGEPPMNFFSGTTENESDGVAFTFADSDARITFPGVETRLEAATLGVRPEYVETVTTTESDITGTVQLIEPMGSHFEAQIDIGTGQATAILETETHIREGDNVGVTFEREQLHLFDAESGRNLAFEGRVES